jgi:hypothetical protein
MTALVRISDIYPSPLVRFCLLFCPILLGVDWDASDKTKIAVVVCKRLMGRTYVVDTYTVPLP